MRGEQESPVDPLLMPPAATPQLDRLTENDAVRLVVERARAISPRVALNRRERDILALLCQRLTDIEIAEHLFIRGKTASHHVASILGKLGATNRRDAAAIAARHGWA